MNFLILPNQRVRIKTAYRVYKTTINQKRLLSEGLH
jgi:hypothetical protein